MNNFIALLISAGGVGFLSAIIAGIKALSSTRLESDAALFNRLNEDSKKYREGEGVQRERAEQAEQLAATLRMQRDEALDKVSRYRRQLIDNGIELDGEKEE